MLRLSVTEGFDLPFEWFPVDTILFLFGPDLGIQHLSQEGEVTCDGIGKQ